MYIQVGKDDALKNVVLIYNLKMFFLTFEFAFTGGNNQFESVRVNQITAIGCLHQVNIERATVWLTYQYGTNYKGVSKNFRNRIL